MFTHIRLKKLGKHAQKNKPFWILKLIADAVEAEVDLDDEDPDMDGWGDTYFGRPKRQG